MQLLQLLQRFLALLAVGHGDACLQGAAQFVLAVFGPVLGEQVLAQYAGRAYQAVLDDSVVRLGEVARLGIDVLQHLPRRLRSLFDRALRHQDLHLQVVPTRPVVIVLDVQRHQPAARRLQMLQRLRMPASLPGFSGPADEGVEFVLLLCGELHDGSLVME
ncbi:hypothetical protein D3C78_1070520 [compost metagenome]